MAYTKVFTKPYASGYKDLPSQTTPITATTLNAKDTAITHIEEYLEDNPIGSDVGWNQITESGTKIAEITIGEEVTEVYAPTGGSGGTTVVANPTLSGDEDDLEGIQVGDTKYKVAGGSGNPNFEYTSEGLTFENCTYSSGGYFVFGNIVFVNIRVLASYATTTELSLNIKNMPVPNPACWGFVVYNNAIGRRFQDSYGFVNASGDVIGRISKCEIGDTISICGWYLK